MKLLELFAGTGSIGKVAHILGMEVTSLDKDMQADIRIDIMNWDYKADFEPNHFDIVWASPPCTEYSKAQTNGHRDLAGANEVVKRTLEIINYLKPTFWIIENPQTGLLKEQSFMEGIPYNDVDYCMYGLLYRKRTRLWNNIEDWTPRPLCTKNCENMSEDRKRHLRRAQRGSAPGYTKNSHRLTELYVVPEHLVRDILVHIMSININDVNYFV